VASSVPPLVPLDLPGELSISSSSLNGGNTVTTTGTIPFQAQQGNQEVMMAANIMTSTSTSPTPSDSTSVSAESGKSGLADPVRKCLRALEAAQTDTEKFATLFLVPKLVKGIDCNKNARLHLMKGIGFQFLARMLRSKDSPDGCPKLMFQSVALSVLSCFANETEIMTHPSVLINIPVMLDIITNADNDIYEENLLIITDAYLCLMAIVTAGEKGRNAFVGNRGIHYMCETVIEQSFRFEDALKLLLHLLTSNVGGDQRSGSGGASEASGVGSCWSYHSGAEDFNSLMLKLCSDFETNQDESKFELCDTIRAVLRSFPKSNFDDEIQYPWLPKLQQGLHDILFSKIGKSQRDPAMILVAAVIEVSDFEWCLAETKENSAAAEKGSRFFQIVCNLACIEVIMNLEDKQLDEGVLESSELLVACYFIIESAVSYLCNQGDRIPSNVLDSQQRGQLYTALKNAFSTILRFLHELSVAQSTLVSSDPKIKYFVCATIRLLGAWLAEETLALREDVYEVLPFILTVANETFESQKLAKLQTLPGRGSTDFSNFTEETMLQRQGDLLTPDTLRFLLPALCHLVVEDKPRKIVLDMKLHETLYTYLSYHWSIFDSFKHWLAQQAAAEDDVDVSEPLFMIDNSKFEMVNSRYAMTTICNVLMNLTVLEPQFINKTPIFFHILKFIINSLPTLDSNEDLVLYGNLSVLGLLILRHHSRQPKSTDFGLCRFVQAIVRFLWDAHNCEESLDEEELGVSSNYLNHWNDLVDLWYLGMQVLAHLLTQIPWIAEFVMESGWPQEVIRTLDKVRRGGIESSSAKSSLEELLCALVKGGGKEVHDEFRKNGVIAVCQTHQFKDLATLISGGNRQQKGKES